MTNLMLYRNVFIFANIQAKPVHKSKMNMNKNRKALKIIGMKTKIEGKKSENAKKKK